MPERILAIDIETTGLYPERGDRILELAALPIAGERIVPEDAFQRFANPGIPIPPEATRINRITDEMVRDAPPLALVLGEFLAYIGELPLVAHNAPFDVGFVRYHALALGLDFPERRVVDTMELSRELFPDARSHSLDALAARLGIVHAAESRHRSLADAHLTALCFLAMKSLM